MFSSDHSFDERRYESERIREKYPERVPVIVEKIAESIDAPDLAKSKFLVPKDLTMGQLIYVVRKRLKLPSEKAMFLYINNQMVRVSSTISELDCESSEDGFLYVRYGTENVFG
jgi:GABA(A) receptor-associated protein